VGNEVAICNFKFQIRDAAMCSQSKLKNPHP
jgi:hypothetical protein